MNQEDPVAKWDPRLAELLFPEKGEPAKRKPYGKRISFYSVSEKYRPHGLGRQRGQFKLKKG